MIRRWLFTLVPIIAACNADRITVPPVTADRVSHPDVVVTSGGSIQQAIDAADPGTVIRIEAGTYHEALTVNQPRISLVGSGLVVIENPGDEETGIAVSAAADRFVLAHVTVRGFKGNGVTLNGVDGFLLSNVTAENDGEYGLFPVLSSHGLIVHCSASGHSDTGIYVGQSDHIAMHHNRAFGNVNGLEVENSSNVTVEENETFDNVAGILVVLLPGLDVKTSSNIRVAHNRVHDNNHVNFGAPGEIESFVPSGSGILIVGTDRTTVANNAVTGNNFTGIAVGSTLLLGALAGLPPEFFADIEPNPDGTHIRGNHLSGNGSASPIPFLPAVDLLWDGSGTRNCWQRNTYATSYPAALPACDD